MRIRAFERERDFDHIVRIHREVGWPHETDAHKEATGLWMADGCSLVAEVGGAAEAFASTHHGLIRHLDSDLPLSVVGGVATSRLARRQGLASRVTAEAIAADVLAEKAAVAVLGVFDQGFYDRLGFGSGPYEVMASFDPADLRVRAPTRTPVRLGLDDVGRMHRGRHARRRPHGTIVVHSEDITRSDVLCSKKGFGLGFESAPGGDLSHHLWCSAGAGPYAVHWLAFADTEQLEDLLGLLKGLGEQVPLVRLVEPPGLQLQDFLRRPMRRRQISIGAENEAGARAAAWWQLRICDVEACIAQTHLPGSDPVAFNLHLSDPIGEHLDEKTAARWSGVAGDYVVHLAADSHAERHAPVADLPTMHASVGAFSRLWLGALGASDLALTSPDLRAPAGLLGDLDRSFRLPKPGLDWDI